MLQVDAGDLLLPLPAPGMIAPDPAEVERRAALLLAGYARLGVSALVPGERDLAVGLDRLAAWTRAHRVPLVAANLQGPGGSRPFPADRLLTVAGVAVGVFGLLEGEAPPPGEPPLPWRTSDAVASARVEVQSLRQRGARLIVGLWHLAGGAPRAREIARQAPGVDVAVLGHQGIKIEQPEVEGQTLLVAPALMGKSLGRLDLHVVQPGAPFQEAGEATRLWVSREQHLRQIEDLRRRMAADPGGQLRPYYERQIRDQEAQVAADAQALQRARGAVRGNWAQNRVLDLDTAYADQVGLSLLVRSYNAASAQRAARGLPVGVAYRSPQQPAAPAGHGPTPPPSPAAPAYSGSAACGACHAQALAVWQGTKHARALRTLQLRGRAKDPTCVGCHSTGSLQQGQPGEAGVGCESCHGPGAAHVAAAGKGAPVQRGTGPALCLGCHTPDQTDKGFEYPSFLKAVLGPGHGQPP